MKKNSIKTHLKHYSIHQKRKTTINHAFASAIAPVDSYDEHSLTKALTQLGQNPNADLKCVYCGDNAKTWDHLVGLVKDSQLRGYGHQMGNLVPCCGECNSKKGKKDWEEYVTSEIKSIQNRNVTMKRLSTHLKRHAKPIDVEQVKKRISSDWAEYERLKEQIFTLMKKADKLADRIRPNVIL